MTTPNLFDLAPPFDGATYDPARDDGRLRPQLDAVRRIMADRQWHTLSELQTRLTAQGIHATEAAVSARVRDLRKAKFGGHTIERRYVADGLFEYRLAVAEAQERTAS